MAPNGKILVTMLGDLVHKYRQRCMQLGLLEERFFLFDCRIGIKKLLSCMSVEKNMDTQQG